MRKIFVFLFFWIFFLSSCGWDEEIWAWWWNVWWTKYSLPWSKIYHRFAGKHSFYDIEKKDLVEWFISDAFSKFDISFDWKNILLMDEWWADRTNSGAQRYVFRPLSFPPVIELNTLKDGKNIFDFEYEWDNIGWPWTSSYISPNWKYIAINWSRFADHPITIIKAWKDENIQSFSDDSTDLDSNVVISWTKDNTLFMRIWDVIYKVPEWEDFSQEKALFKLPWISQVAVNPDWTKLVFRKEKHLFLSNIDWTGITQLTTSKTMDVLDDDWEIFPAFSPDGKYVVFGALSAYGTPLSKEMLDGSTVVATWWRFGYMAIVPADWKTYDVDSKVWVFFPTEKDGSLIAQDGRMIWK